MHMPHFELKVVKGELSGQGFPLGKFPVNIGRALDTDITIPEDDELVSRYHCEIDLKDEQLVIKDSGSSNGTYVNGCEISEKEVSPLLPVYEKNPEGVCHWIALNENDEIEVGDSVFSVQIKEEIRKAEELDYKAKSVDLFYDTDHLERIEHYKILGKIGSGGAGDVFKVKDTTTGQIVALKMLKYRIQRKEDELKRFLREIDNLNQLQHPNIIQFLETGQKNGIYYFTTEYCNGGSLIDWLKTRDTLVPLNEALTIILQVLDALEYAHTFNLDKEFADDVDLMFSGLVHRDIKPGNILLNKDENGNIVAKIADFGLSKVRAGGSSIGMLTKTGTVGGTVEFLCKQQMIDYKHVRGAVDLWSAVAVLYFMLTAETPRNFQKHVPPYKTILSEPPVPIRERLPDFPETFAVIIDRALDDTDALYYKNAKDLKVDLKRMQTITQADN